ncbi:GNAT family N-acetyltransferase [Ancylomarina euxinus]|uniref:GNAT family N-acetyltransferase n=1 Tax=Ancylomarina euxinus TaxID=2283627 RepID=A0A425XWR4_9BACT|nr:GNAT family N-acetyltransferase [Ancylomarina euxinus]MCZ4696339.1 GNAT family N-acetyltransferase [Ancylomarina euxinus]MUP16760.1 GNAT family N-acetyltransferase [Ancylomarina euxinus]RRG19080.1 GNAT family N-acetyltransferase [Ancylomarina euxinus]
MKITKIEKKIPVGFIDVHNQAFCGFFLTSLGTKFLKLYYSSVLKSPKGLVLCLQDDIGTILGFAAGTTYSKGFLKNILFHNFFSYVWVLFTGCISRPKAIYRLLNNLKKGGDKNVDFGDYAELLSIAVPPQYKGLGYGKLLLQAFEIELLKLETRKSTLTTDYFDNEGVIAFYKNMGYEIFYDFISYPNRRMYKFIKNL